MKAICSLLLVAILCGYAFGEDLRCLSVTADPPPAKAIYAQLQQQAYAALERREKSLETLETPEQILAYQARLKQFFEDQLGGFPERTPLNAEVVGKQGGDGYRLEKVVFESRPHQHVTAVLYLPDGPGPFPGVAVSSGHSRTAKTAEYNQRFGIALAKGGIAALCYDPIGQGERSQILNDEGQPRFTGTVHEHTLVGIGSTLVGRNTASYRTWDGIRAIDYLVSRPDIDAKRIGFTGCSGGGTLTSYVMALDDRVLCAAPACYLTTFRRLIETIGPQDAEQNIYGQIAFGLDQPDYVLMRAQRPTLISSTTSDFFDIDGSWNSYRQAKRLYWRLGYPERVDLVEGAGGHGVPQQNLTAIVRWMRRWLLNKDDAFELPEISVRRMEDLLCTGTGQVLTLPNEKSVFDLNAEFERSLAEKRHTYWQQTPTPDALRAVRQTVGVRGLDEIGKLRMEKVGRVQRDDFHIDKLVLRTPAGVPIPTLTFHPPDPKADAYLYLHEGGKAADAAVGGPIEKLVSQGYVVVAVDLRGFGETAPDENDKSLGYRFSEQTFFLAYLLKQSLVGLRTEDALACGNWVANYETDKPRKVHLIGIGSAGLVALHAAALEPELFATLTLRQTLPSWTKLVGEPVPADRLSDTVHGALHVYDLPDLIGTLGAKRVKIEETP